MALTWLSRRPYLLAIGSLLLLVPFLGSVHLFDWDEINFAECAREMVRSGTYGRAQMNFLPFWEKPPLFFWLQAMAMHVFGVGAFAARLPNALCGALVAWLLFYWGRQLHGSRFGVVWSLAYLGSLLPQFYFHSGLIDPWFNLFIFSSLFFLMENGKWKMENKGQSFLFSIFHFPLAAGVFAGLAVITKGPVALLLIGLTLGVTYTLQQCWSALSFRFVGLFGAGLVGVVGLWLAFGVWDSGWWFIQEFITYNLRLAATEDAGHGGFPGYHLVMLGLGCFPASFFLIAGWRYLYGEAKQGGTALLMAVLLLVVLVVFSLVRTKIVHYSSLAYFPLTYLAARQLERMLAEGKPLAAGLKAALLGFAGLLAVVCVGTFYIVHHQRPFLHELTAKDPFAQANLDALLDMKWTNLEWLTGFAVLGVAVWAVRLWGRRQIETAIATLFGGMAVCITLILYAFIGRAESISQAAAIDFLESKAKEDCYILPIGYRTYAHFFYADQRPENSPPARMMEPLHLVPKQWQDSLLLNPVSKPVYVISKVNKLDDLTPYPALKEIGRRNGFVFFVKEL